jgi:Secreted repeat of unknown function
MHPSHCLAAGHCGNDGRRGVGVLRDPTRDLGPSRLEQARPHPGQWAGQDPVHLGPQVTYHGHPLYTFAGDKKAGDTKGEGLTGFGGRWDPVSAAGRAVTADDRNGYETPVKLSVITPGAGDVAGAGGVFNVDLSLHAQNARGNSALSAANGYVPFFNDIGSSTFGPGKPDPGAPGLVVTLSTTPAAAGGPNANLAGVFQLNAVNKHHGLIQTFNDWQVGVPGFFGTTKSSTLTAYLVDGTAPGVITPGLKPISNVVHETFTIGG